MFVPSNRSNAVDFSSHNLSVIVFIHGVGFDHGSGNHYSGDRHLALVGGDTIKMLNTDFLAFGSHVTMSE